MEHIGYSLINSSNTEVQFWGDLIGQTAAVPAFIHVDQYQVHSPSTGSVVPGYRLVERWVSYDAAKPIELKLSENIAFDGTKTVVEYVYRTPTKAELKEYSANTRYHKEIGGADIGGVNIYTDRESQAMITGIISLMQLAPETVINFKTADGFISANAATMISLAVGIATHIQTCFSLENYVTAQIEANNITTLAQVDAAYE